MTDPDYLLIVFGMSLVTFVPRWLPLFCLTRMEMPQWLIEWLDLIPVAILSALICAELFTSGDPRHLDLVQPKLAVAAPTFLFAWKTGSLAGTVLVGMLLYWAVGKLF